MRIQIRLGQLVVKLRFHLPRIEFGLCKMIVKLGLLVGVVVSQLVKRSLKTGDSTIG